MLRSSKVKYSELSNLDEQEDAGGSGDNAKPRRSGSVDVTPLLPASSDDFGDDNDDEAHLKSLTKSFPAGDDAALEEFYKPVDGYEGAHRFDSQFSWTAADEKEVVRKIDRWICSWVCIMFFALQLDRGNIVQALSDNMLRDLGLNTNDYNYGQAIFFFAFLTAELPSQLISKWVGPDRWIPIQMVTWSIVDSSQAFLSGRKSFFFCRASLGMIEGGFIPDNVLYLSYFYTRLELPKRISWLYVSSQTTNIVSAFFAYGILHLRGWAGLEGWRWLFGLEGILTATIGVMSWFYLPASPTQTPGWFTAHEEKVMVNRILRDDPSKGDMYNRQALSWEMLVACLTDWYMYPIYLIALTFGMPNNPMTAYLTLQLGNMGFGTFQTNLLTIPAYVLFIAQLLFWTWLSEK